MKQREQTDNRGLSLVELIVVMAIVGILAGVLIMGVGMISGKPAEQCARQIKATMEHCRTMTMGKGKVEGDIYLKFEQDSEGVWVTFSQGGSSEKSKVGSGDVIVTYKFAGDSEFKNLKGNGPLEIKFDRSSGGLLQSDKPGGGTGYCTEFKISRGSTVRTLKIARLTGKIQIE